VPLGALQEDDGVDAVERTGVLPTAGDDRTERHGTERDAELDALHDWPPHGALAHRATFAPRSSEVIPMTCVGRRSGLAPPGGQRLGAANPYVSRPRGGRAGSPSR